MPNLVVRNHRGSCTVFYKNIEDCHEFVKSDNPSLLIADINISFLYPSLLKNFSYINEVIYLESGEKTKTLDGVISLLKKIDNLNKYPINNILVIGGATLQDTAGTALALLKRGTKWIYIPTTLLAQADSCIGSKTSINSDNAKNIFGLFYSPNKIFILDEFLYSLPEMEIISGIGDAMHYLLLDINKNSQYIFELINFLLKSGPTDFVKKNGQVGQLCQKCHEIKRYYIEIDEFDQNQRKVLNLGHSFGHALESFLDFKLPHGIAVLFGLIIAGDVSLYLFNKSLTNKFKDNFNKIKLGLIEILERYSPIKPKTVYQELNNNPDIFMNILKKDKKNSSNEKYSLILYKNDYPILVKCDHKLIMNYIKTLK